MVIVVLLVLARHNLCGKTLWQLRDDTRLCQNETSTTFLKVKHCKRMAEKTRTCSFLRKKRVASWGFSGAGKCGVFVQVWSSIRSIWWPRGFDHVSDRAAPITAAPVRKYITAAAQARKVNSALRSSCFQNEMYGSSFHPHLLKICSCLLQYSLFLRGITTVVWSRRTFVPRLHCKVRLRPREFFFWLT